MARARIDRHDGRRPLLVTDFHAARAFGPLFARAPRSPLTPAPLNLAPARRRPPRSSRGIGPTPALRAVLVDDPGRPARALAARERRARGARGQGTPGRACARAARAARRETKCARTIDGRRLVGRYDGVVVLTARTASRDASGRRQARVDVALAGRPSDVEHGAVRPDRHVDDPPAILHGCPSAPSLPSTLATSTGRTSSGRRAYPPAGCLLPGAAGRPPARGRRARGVGRRQRPAEPRRWVQQGRLVGRLWMNEHLSSARRARTKRRLTCRAGRRSHE